jgi:hypothetical protein
MRPAAPSYCGAHAFKSLCYFCLRKYPGPADVAMRFLAELPAVVVATAVHIAMQVFVLLKRCTLCEDM